MGKVSDNARTVNEQSGEVDRSVRQMQDRYTSIMAEVMEIAESTEHNMSAAQQILAGIEAQDSKIHEIVRHYQDLDNLILTLSTTAAGVTTQESTPQPPTVPSGSSSGGSEPTSNSAAPEVKTNQAEQVSVSAEPAKEPVSVG